MLRRFMDRTGMMTVEAAIFFPIFFLSLLSFVSVIPMVGTQETVVREFTLEAMEVAQEAYLTKMAGEDSEQLVEPFGAKIARERMENHLQNQLSADKRIGKLSLIEFQYLFTDAEITGLIRSTLGYEFKIPIPLLSRQLEFGTSILYRGFIGSETSTTGRTFEAMETEEESKIVYVFPRAGEKYHRPECRVIHSHANEVFITASLKSVFAPCPVCNAETIPIGAKAYCFPNGTVYHRGICPIVDRYVVAMEKETAEELGYLPCMICGGY